MHDEQDGSGAGATGIAVASSALMTLRACSFNSSTALLRWSDVFLGKNKKAAMCISRSDVAKLATSEHYREP
jgi:hypothetical protein